MASVAKNAAHAWINLTRSAGNSKPVYLLDVEFSDLVPIREQWLYLDHAQKGPLPRPTTEAMAKVIATEREGAFWQTRELEQMDLTVRALLAQVFGCQASDISLFPDRYWALIALLSGLARPSGAQALLAGENPDKLAPLKGFLERLGYQVQLLAPVRWTFQAEALFSSLPEVHVAVLPWVDETGWVLDLATLAEALGKKPPTIILDASQALPCRPEAFAEVGVDAVLIPSHTWFLAPPGITALVSTESLRKRWSPVLPPHRKATAAGSLDAANFEGQALPAVLLAGLAASLQLLLAQGLAEVRKRIWAHQRTVTTVLLELGWTVVSPGAAHPVAGIVVAQHPFFPAKEVQDRLEQKRVRVGVLGPWVRFSPHFYTTIAELAALRQLLERL